MHNQNLSLFTTLAKTQYDIVNVRLRVREVMKHLGFLNLAQTMMSTAVSEILRNACMYAGGGSVKFFIESKDNRSVFCIGIQDKGPGIDNLPLIIAGKYSRKRSLGRGIFGAKQIVDDFIIQSEPQKGTYVCLKMKIVDNKIINPDLVRTITTALAKMPSHDIVSELQQQNQEVLYALELVNKARDELEQRVAERTAEILATNKQLEQEVKKREEVNQELIETTSRLDLALKSAKVGTWSYDSLTDKISLDAYSLALLGVKDFGGTYQDFIQFLHPSNTFHEMGNLFLLSQAMAQGELELRMECPNRNTLYLMPRGQACKDAEGNTIKIIGVFWDITQRKMLEGEFRQYQEQTIQVSRASAIGGVASILAHEINQPLTVISTYVQGCIRRISNDSPAEELRPVLKKVAEQAQRAGEIVHRIKDFVKRGTLLLEPININELLKNLLNLIYQDPNNPKINFHFQLEDGLPQIKIDRFQIEQVLINLIRNSMEALYEQRKSSPEVILYSKKTENSIVIRVMDNGPGFSIPAEDLFKPYLTTKTSGMGMGLVICRDIIEAHGGTIKARSRKNGGACFECELPFLPGEHNEK